MRVTHNNNVYYVHFLFAGPREGFPASALGLTTGQEHVPVVIPHHTVAIIEDERGHLLGLGKAKKSPADTVSFEEGEKHALTVALKKLGLPREARAAFWAKYRITGGGKPKWGK